VFGGTAYDGSRVYVPCNGVGVVAVAINGSSFSVAWESDVSGTAAYSAGAPILAGGVVWSLAQGGGTLYGFDPATGVKKFQIGVCATTRFASPSADGGRIFIPCTSGVEAIQFSSFTVNNTYLYPWYDHLSSPGFKNDNIHVVNPNGSPVSITLTIPGQPGCNISDTIPAAGANYYGCATGFGGPVVLKSSARVDSTQRVQYYQSFNEVPALPTTAAATSLYFTWYDLVSSPGFMADNVHVVNPNASAATVTVSIPGCGPQSASVGAGSGTYFGCATGYGGPVTVTSSIGVLASQRVQYYQTFNEVPALSAANAATTQYFPWYDLISSPGFRNDNVHVIDPTGSSASVTVNIPGCGPQSATLAPGGERYFGCATGYGGPVTVVSTGTPILASQRVQYYQSFNEVTGQPATAAATTLYFSWYDHVSDPGFLNDNVHIVNPSAGTANVTVSIPGCGPQGAALGAGGETYFGCASGFGGPVKVTTTGTAVLASQRVQYYQSFNEVSAQP
jgi:Ni,Fe-hydrogenase III small subunit